MSTNAELRQAIRAAVAATDSPWRLDRGNTQHRTTEAVVDAVWAQLTTAIDVAEERGYRAGRKEATHDAGRASAAGYHAGRLEALHEAATMLKRHGHRTAVDRVQALATPTVGTDTDQAPTEPPRPTPSPQNGTSAAEPIVTYTTTPATAADRAALRDALAAREARRA